MTTNHPDLVEMVKDASLELDLAPSEAQKRNTIAAMTLNRRDALLVTAALWPVNQIIGFTVLHYPWDPMTFMWGGFLGAVAMMSTGATLAVVSQRSLAASVLASFAAAFIFREGQPLSRLRPA